MDKLYYFKKKEHLEVITKYFAVKIRKYYSVTPKSKETLKKAKMKIKELVNKVI